MTTARKRSVSVGALARLGVAEARKRPMRILVTLGTIALGATALTTSLVLGSSVQTAVDRGLLVEYQNVDVLLRTDAAMTEDTASGGGGGAALGVDRASLRKIRALPEVGATGTYVRTTGVAQVGSVAQGVSLESVNSDRRFRWQRWAAGRAPGGTGEIALNKDALRLLKIRMGDAVALSRPGIPRTLYRVVGVVDTRGSLARQGRAYGVVTTRDAELFAGLTTPNTLDIEAKPGADVDDLVNGINRVAPIGLPERASEILSAGKNLQLGAAKALSSVVAALAGVSCVVAAMTSATISGASLSSRRRTWGLLRCVGASRRHIAGLVAAESLVLSLTASGLGVLLGLAVARVALPAVGLVPGLPPLAASAYTVTAKAVVLPVVLSLALALAASLVPVWLAVRIPASAALKASVTPVRPPSALKVGVLAALLVGGSIGAYVAGGDNNYPVLLACVAAILVASGPLILPLLLSAATLLAGRRLALPVRLGLRDVVRRPRAASIEAMSVAFAVAMVALSLVTLSSVAASTSARLNESPSPDLVVGAAAGSSPISPRTVAKVRAVAGLDATVAVRFGRDVTILGRGADGKASIAVGTAAGSTREFNKVLPAPLPVSAIRDDTVYLPKSGLPPFFPDSKVSVRGPTGTVKDLSVVYIDGLQLPSLVSRATLAEVSKKTDNLILWLSLKPGADRARVVDEITGITLLDRQLPVAGPTVLDIRTAQAFSTARAAAVAILSVSVLVAIIGATATAALSISERAREHATLRALGLPRRNLRRLLGVRVLFVSLAAALYGALIGSVLGVVASRVVINQLGIGIAPTVALGILPIAVIMAGTLTAVRTVSLIPVERASYIPPSRALAEA